MGLGQTRQQLYSPALFCGHSWSYDGPIENILCQNDFTCPIMHFVRFLVLDQTGTVISSPGHRWANLGPMVGRRVDRAKIYLLKFSTCPNIHYIRFNQPLSHSWSFDGWGWADRNYTLSNRFYMPYYAFCSLFGARSNRTRDILYGPPLGHSWSYGWL